MPKPSDFNLFRKMDILDSGLRRNDGISRTGSRHAGLDKPAPAGFKPGASSRQYFTALLKNGFDSDMVTLTIKDGTECEIVA